MENKRILLGQAIKQNEGSERLAVAEGFFYFALHNIKF